MEHPIRHLRLLSPPQAARVPVHPLCVCPSSMSVFTSRCQRWFGATPLCVCCWCFVCHRAHSPVLVGSVFQKKIVGMALTKRTVQSLPVSA